MIREEIRKLKIPFDELEKKEAYKNPENTYDTQTKTNEFSFAVNCAYGKGFYLVYNDKKAVIINGTDKTITSTIHTMKEFDTEEQVLKHIEYLGLEYINPENDLEQEELNKWQQIGTQTNPQEQPR